MISMLACECGGKPAPGAISSSFQMRKAPQPRHARSSDLPGEKCRLALSQPVSSLHNLFKGLCLIIRALPALDGNTLTSCEDDRLLALAALLRWSLAGHFAGPPLASSCASHEKATPDPPPCSSRIAASAPKVAWRAQSRCHSHRTASQVIGLTP